MTWTVENLRVTAFGKAATALPTWEQLTRSRPMQTTEQGQLRQVQGIFEERNLLIMHQPSRADLVFMPVQASNVIPEDIFHLGELPGPLARMRELAKQWIDVNGEFDRLAVGCVIGETASSADAAADVVWQKAPLSPRGDRSAIDLLIQINRPRTSVSVPEINLNRLIKWQTANVRMIPLLSGGASLPVEPPVFDRAQLDMDINTQPAKRIPAGKAHALIDEMAGLVEAVSQHGDAA